MTDAPQDSLAEITRALQADHALNDSTAASAALIRGAAAAQA